MFFYVKQLSKMFGFFTHSVCGNVYSDKSKLCDYLGIVLFKP